MHKKRVKKVLATSMVAGTVLAMGLPTAVSADGTVYQVTKVSEYSIVDGIEQTVDIDYVTNPNGGPTLGLLHNENGPDDSNEYILEVEAGGYKYAFKDMNKNGVLDDYEDWRLPTEQRAQSLAEELASTDAGIEQIAGLMMFSSHESDSSQGLTTVAPNAWTQAQTDYLDNSYVRNITHAAGNNVKDSVGWSNAMQAYVEASDFNVPVDFSSDPRSTAGSGDLYSDNVDGSDLSGWPSNIGLAATFDTNHMYSFAKATSAEYRAMGIVTALGPQIDLATEPRWLRVGGTFGENTLLATDMAQAYVDGSQSTYTSDGTDIGWGEDSINCMIKHFPGDGAGESGREAHTRAGKYAVYPGGNFDEHLIPFAEGGLKLNGATGSATAVMTSYSIGINADGSALGGERVGSAYSSYKMNLLRNTLGFDGVVCTDWGVTSTPPGDDEEMSIMTMGMAWGMEDESEAVRHYEILKAGTDMFGGNNDATPLIAAFDMMKLNEGEAAARALFAKSAKRLILLTMEPGLFENPYLNSDESLAIAGSAEKVNAGYNVQLDSVVMLKNKDNTIKPAAEAEKDPSEMTVYIPRTYTKEQYGIFGRIPETWDPTLNLDVAETIYKNVLTDTIDSDGNFVTPDLSNVDKVIVGMRSPNNGSLFDESGMKLEDGVEKFYPLTLQYRPYTADGANVRRTSIAGNIEGGVQQNRSYYGATSEIYNEYDLDACLNAVEAVKATGKDIPIVVALNATGGIIVNEFESQVDAIVCGFSVSDSAIFDVIEGNHEPRGLLPIQFPANMDTVEANQEDVAGDLICHKDSEGNTYDVAYGLNWDGLIDDARVQRYNKDRPTTEPPVVIDPEPTPTPDPDPTPNPGATPEPGTKVTTGDDTDFQMYLAIGLLAATVAGLAAYKKIKKV